MLPEVTAKWLSAEVSDSTTGLKGHVAALNYYTSGTIQATVQPKGDGKKIPEAWSIDIELLKITKPPPKKSVVMMESDIALGDKVKDKMTGFEGFATVWMRCHNGCIEIFVEPVVDKDGKSERARLLSSARLKVIKQAKESLGRKDSSPGAGCLPQRDLRNQ